MKSKVSAYLKHLFLVCCLLIDLVMYSLSSNVGLVQDGSRLSLLLPGLILCPLLGSFFVFMLPSRHDHFSKVGALWVRSLCFPVSCLLWVFFDCSGERFQFIWVRPWFPSLNIALSMGIDGISLFFILLTTFLIPLCILTSWNVIKRSRQLYFGSFLALEGLVILVFRVTDLLSFYVALCIIKSSRSLAYFPLP